MVNHITIGNIFMYFYNLNSIVLPEQHNVAVIQYFALIGLVGWCATVMFCTRGLNRPGSLFIMESDVLHTSVTNWDLRPALLQ